MFERPDAGERAVLVRLGLGNPASEEEIREFEAAVAAKAAESLTTDADSSSEASEEGETVSEDAEVEAAADEQPELAEATAEAVESEAPASDESPDEKQKS